MCGIVIFPCDDHYQPTIAMCGTKIPVQELLEKWEGGLYARGGVLAGYLQYYLAFTFSSTGISYKSSTSMTNVTSSDSCNLSEICSYWMGCNVHYTNF